VDNTDTATATEAHRQEAVSVLSTPP
jgi:hypothetical protein